MRVIGGKAKGRRLKKVPGDTTRPIMDRVKESLFNIIGTEIHDTRWLDLFAGTGQVGIEALSRGAAYCLFVDKARAAVHTVQDNLRLTGLANQGRVQRGDAFTFLNRPPEQDFDMIYVAPPQYKEMWGQVLTQLDKRPFPLLAATATVIVQIDPKEYRELPLQQLQLYDQRRYGNTLLCFYEQLA